MANPTQSYYDEFSKTYEDARHEGYHRLIDDLEVAVAQRYCGGAILEVGCGTGLILSRLAARATLPVGVDLSSGMLSHAAGKHLRVAQASAELLPFADGTFDSIFSFKVLAHVKAIRTALAEMARITKDGGHLILEFYNRRSIRYAIKVLKQPDQIGGALTDEDVYTRFDTLASIRSYLPAELALKEHYGVRVVTPAASLLRVPLLRDVMIRAEHLALNHRLLRNFGGFLVVVLEKTGR
jgi:ubiquinone/menaquinone biosynthesis C-methylase UbiE